MPESDFLDTLDDEARDLVIQVSRIIACSGYACSWRKNALMFEKWLCNGDIYKLEAKAEGKKEQYKIWKELANLGFVERILEPKIHIENIDAYHVDTAIRVFQNIEDTRFSSDIQEAEFVVNSIIVKKVDRERMKKCKGLDWESLVE